MPPMAALKLQSRTGTPWRSSQLRKRRAAHRRLCFANLLNRTAVPVTTGFPVSLTARNDS